MHRDLRLSLALGSCLVAGCGASVPMVEESAFPIWPAPDDPCVQRLTPIGHVDEPTPLGFSALDALQHLAGSRSSPLFWLEPPEGQDYLLSYGPERGRSSLDVDVRLAEGTVYHRYREPQLGAPDDTSCDGDGSSEALLIPVTVSLESAAQGLAERFDAVLEAETPHHGHISKALEARALGGSLSLAKVASLDKDRAFWLGPVRFEAELWEGGSAGSLAIGVDVRPAKVSDRMKLGAPINLEQEPAPLDAAQPGPLAVWPSARVCEGGAIALPSSAQVLGFSVDDVLARLNGATVRDLTWSDGSVTAMRIALGSEELELCQELGGGLGFDVMLEARDASGAFDLRVPVRVEAGDGGGVIADIRVESADPDAAFTLEPSAPTHAGFSSAGAPTHAGFSSAGAPTHAGFSSAGAPTGVGAARVRFDARGYRAVLVGVEWSQAGGRETGSLSLRGVDALRPDENGVYPSTLLETARW